MLIWLQTSIHTWGSVVPSSYNISTIISRDIILLAKICIIKAMFFSSSHVWMWELEYEEDWMPKNWCSHIVVLEKTLESPLDFKEIKPDNPKGNQPWIFIGRTDAEAEAPIPWPSDVKSQLIVNSLVLGKIEGKRRSGWKKMRYLDSVTNSKDMNLSKPREIVENRGTWHSAVSGVVKSWTQLSDWTTT